MDNSQNNRAGASLSERTLLIALIGLEAAFVMLYAFATGLLPRP